MTTSRIAVAAAVLLAVGAPVAAQHETHAAPPACNCPVNLGKIAFENSGNAAAQEPFRRGVALLHSYEYADAASAFREAQRADPALALAYWMEALTYSRIDWRYENVPASRAVLARLGPSVSARVARGATPREREFGAAVEAFYMEGSQLARVRAYADSLRSFARRHPDEVEAQAFASHAIMLAGVVAPQRAERDSLFREAIALSQAVLRQQPSHPGATHYLIHLYDNPGLASNGLEFARAYDKIAPDAEHALHMPSHIYLQLGMWDDVVASNERAWVASRKANAPSWHTLSWLQYGYLQQRRFDRALALIDTARAIVPSVAAADMDARVAIPRLEFQYAAATGKWTQSLTQPIRVPSTEMSERENGFLRAATYWSAVTAAMLGDSAGVATYGGRFVATADSALAGESVGASRLALANALVVRALIARSRGDRDTYVRALRMGAAAEQQLEPFIGPPERIFASELLGEELVARGDKSAGAEQFRAVLKLCPGRVESVQGLALAK